MNKNQQIFDELNEFLLSIKNIDPKILEYGISFNLKIFSFQEMHLRTLDVSKELKEAQKKEVELAKTVNPFASRNRQGIQKNSARAL